MNDAIPDTSAKRKMSASEWASQTPGLVILIVMLGLAAILLYPGNSRTTDVAQARGVLAVLFSLATIVLAFSLVVGVLLSEDSQNSQSSLKERFQMGNQVLTPLIGIMGTILGFYFGTSDANPIEQPLSILDVTTPSAQVVAGEVIPVTVFAQGGHGPWEYDLDFGDALKRISRKVHQNYLRESITLPRELGRGALGLSVTVTDARGTTVIWSRKPGEWVTVSPSQTNEKPERPVETPDDLPSAGD